MNNKRKAGLYGYFNSRWSWAIQIADAMPPHNQPVLHVAAYYQYKAEQLNAH